MKNQAIADLFQNIAGLLELAGENRFKVRAYHRASETIAGLADDVETLAREGKLTALPGIGQSIAEKVAEYCASGTVQAYEDLRKKFPEAVIPAGRMLLWEALRLSKTVSEELRGECRSIQHLEPAGSLRRWQETVGDLDFICLSDHPEDVMKAFAHLTGMRKILSQEETHSSILIGRGIQCGLRVVPKESFGSALLYFTGSRDHNAALRELAVRKGLTLNEYGLFSASNRTRPVAGRTEEEVFKKLGLEFIPPELREDRGEIEAAAKKRLPKLIEEKDVRGDLHNHTNLSDGSSTLEEMAARAKEKGWEWFASGDHSDSLKIVHGLHRKALLEKKEAVKKLNRKDKDFEILLSSEVDIMNDGSLDYDEETLKELDFVVASVHTGFKQSEEKITSRLVAAIRNPYVDAVAHLTGRLLNTREPYAVNVQKVLAAAEQSGTALEINGQPERLDLYDTHAKKAGELGIPILLSTDAHSTAQLDTMTLAVATARRAWLTKDQVLNCLDLPKLKAWKHKRFKEALKK